VFTHPMTLVGPQGEETVQAMVDSGATLSFASADLLRRLGVQPNQRRRFQLADGRAQEFEIGQVVTRVDDREVVTLCVFGESTGPTLLGAYTLEGLFLGVDPYHQRLIPVDGYLLYL